MGGKSGPDYGDLAMQQGEVDKEVNRDQTYANRPSQYTPWGYTSWTNESVIDPSTGQPTTKWSQTQGLTPELQDIFNKQVAIQGGRTDVAGALTDRMGSEFGTPMDWSGLSPMGTRPNSQFTMPEGDIGDPNAFRQQSQDAMYNMAKSRLDPMYGSKRSELETKLRNQGIGPEDAAYKAQMSALGNQETDAYNQANWSSVGAGRDESNAMYSQLMGRNQQNFNQALGANAQNYSQSMQGANYANQIRQQQMTEAMQKRGFSLNEINALLSGQQVNAPQMPNFSQAAAANAAPVYQAGVAQGNFDQASNPMSGLMGLAGTAAGGALSNPGLFT
jgi:hypothetical protein